VIPKKEKKL
jgi:hypothetical protein